MYTVIYPNGKVMTFTVAAVAELYAKNNRGVLITPQMVKMYERMANV